MLSYYNIMVQNYLTITVVVLSIIVFVLAKFWFARQIENIKSRRRIDRGLQKEQEAKGLLISMGFRVVGEQREYSYELKVNDKIVGIKLRIDYLVERLGKIYVVEVKTGEKATSILSSSTRRQILEYATIIPCDGVYLLDMEMQKLSKIEFPLHPSSKSGLSISFLFWLIIGLSLGYFLARLLN